MNTPGNAGKPATIYDVAELVGKAFPLAFTQNNICNGFKKSGLFPLDENIFDDHEFLSSNVTDRPLSPENESDLSVVAPQSISNGTTDDNEYETFNTEPPINNIGLNLSEPSTSYATPIITTPKSKQDNLQTLVSPEDIRPFPKALPRKATRKGRPN